MTPRPARVEGAEEHLDEPAHDLRTLRESLAHVAAVNRWLGGRRALMRHFPAAVPGTGRIDVLDVGTGSADLPRVVARWGRSERRAMRIVASDVHPQMIEIAREECAGYPEIEVRRADALSLPFDDRSFDVVLLSMTLHHFEGAQQVEVLREAARVCRGRIIVGELERSWPNYVGAKLLAGTLWRGNRLTRHDGPLSVLRAFTADELLDLAERAGLRAARVHRHVFYRLLLVAAPA